MLDELLAAVPRSAIHYWRDGAGHDVDFAIAAGRDSVAAIEAKLAPEGLRVRALSRFRAAHPDGPNLLCAPFVEEPFPRRVGSQVVTVCSPRHLAELLRAPAAASA